jgi:two-component system CitB family sensor kinase
MAAVLAIGALLSMALSRRLKRQTFGLELDEIAGLLQERESMLHGIREGLLGIDKSCRVLLVNDQARHLLDLPHGVHGSAIKDILPAGRLRDVVLGSIEGPDQILVIGDRVVVANRMPMRTDYRGHLGWVVTFQDRTKSEELLRELDTVVGLTEALRAQSHEFSNRLHILMGLVELGRNEEAVAFVTDVTSARNELDMQLIGAVDDPTITALLLGKSSVATEHGVELSVVAESRVRVDPEALPDLLRLIGNLIDNATDAAASMHRKVIHPFVEVYLRPINTALELRVSDSGAGIAEDDRCFIFTDGWSTKTSRTGARRGLGLALVREIVERRNGQIDVTNELGAVFSVTLPDVVRPGDDDADLQSVFDELVTDPDIYVVEFDAENPLSHGRTT